MTHEECRSLLSALLDGEAPAAEARRAAEHMTLCQECGAARDQLAAISAAVSSLERERMPESVKSHLLRAAAPSSTQQRRTWLVPSWALGSAAAAVLVTVALLAHRENISTSSPPREAMDDLSSLAKKQETGIFGESSAPRQTRKNDEDRQRAKIEAAPSRREVAERKVAAETTPAAPQETTGPARADAGGWQAVALARFTTTVRLAAGEPPSLAPFSRAAEIGGAQGAVGGQLSGSSTGAHGTPASADEIIYESDMITSGVDAGKDSKNREETIQGGAARSAAPVPKPTSFVADTYATHVLIQRQGPVVRLAFLVGVSAEGRCLSVSQVGVRTEPPEVVLAVTSLLYAAKLPPPVPGKPGQIVVEVTLPASR